MKIGIAVPSGQLGPKLMRGLDRAFRHLGHETVVYPARSDTYPTREKLDLNLIWGIHVGWFPEEVQTFQVWGQDPIGWGPEVVETIIQRQRDGDMVLMTSPEWVEHMRAEHGLHRGRHVPLGADTLVEWKPELRLHRFGVFGGAFPDRVAEVAHLIAGGADIHLWGPGWENIPMFKGRHQGVIEDEAELLRAISSCDSVITLKRSSALPFSHEMALHAGVDAYDGIDAYTQHQPSRRAARTLIDVAGDILKLFENDRKDYADRVKYQIEADNPWASIAIRWTHEDNLNIFDLKCDGPVEQMSVPTMLRLVAQTVEDNMTGAPNTQKYEVMA